MSWLPVTFKEFYFGNSSRYIENVLNDYLVWNQHQPTPFIDWYRRHHAE